MHTPGPWHYEEREHIHMVRCQPTREKEQPDIVFIPRYGSVISQNRPGPELEANARLIAAAPELLGALMQLVRMLDADFPMAVQTKEYKAACLVIKKAEGRS